jgi:cytoskeletal protein RodZ
MSEDLQAVGQLFSQKRKEMKLSLKEVESATSIRIGYLESIEAGQMENVISPIYAQGFVKQYAAFLGLDGDKIVSENSEVFRRPINQEFSYGIGTLEPRGSPGGGVKLMPSVMWLVAFGAVFAVAYFLARSLEVL